MAVEWVSDPDDFYLLPIEAGYYKYPDLIDGSIHIEHIAECQDAMARSAENKDRARMALERKA